MGLFFAYILKSSLCLVAFYLFYKVLLSRETFYRFNRFALLSIMALSAVLPLVQITLEHPSEVGQTIVSVEDWLVEVVSVEEAAPVLTWPQAFVLLYMVGVLFFVLRHVFSVGRLLQLLRYGRRGDAGPYLSDAEGITLIAVDDKLSPFSWMRYIVVSEKDLHENVREILLHECAHIRHRHSWDLLVAEYRTGILFLVRNVSTQELCLQNRKAPIVRKFLMEAEIMVILTLIAPTGCRNRAGCSIKRATLQK